MEFLEVSTPFFAGACTASCCCFEEGLVPDLWGGPSDSPKVTQLPQTITGSSVRAFCLWNLFCFPLVLLPFVGFMTLVPEKSTDQKCSAKLSLGKKKKRKKKTNRQSHIPRRSQSWLGRRMISQKARKHGCLKVSRLASVWLLCRARVCGAFNSLTLKLTESWL